MNSLSSDLVRVAVAGDSALVAEFPQRIDLDINERAQSRAARLRHDWGEILRDVVVGYCTVTVYFNPRYVDARYIPKVDDIVETVARESRDGDLVVIMSNGGFDDIHQKLLTALDARGRRR